MSKLINEPIELITINNFPFEFRFRRLYKIKYIHKYWREAGEWWLDQPELHVYKVSTNHCYCELHFSPKDEQWILYRLAD
ncbi:MAG: hypothetical protein QM401_03065 [Bacillota bacterium]|nr:hypothetical protein [Bacillota bacterium]